jgi:hypothetical protein
MNYKEGRCIVVCQADAYDKVRVTCIPDSKTEDAEALEVFLEEHLDDVALAPDLPVSIFMLPDAQVNGYNYMDELNMKRCTGMTIYRVPVPDLDRVVNMWNGLNKNTLALFLYSIRI